MAYSPFDKPLGTSLDIDDLSLLLTRCVAEGYHVEFKREFPTALKIARSLASLANTYGGWYIVGITTNQHNVAEAITGFDSAQTPDPVSVLRDAARAGIDPSPLFYPQIVALSDGRLVALVYVPEGQPGPFITRDGRIYRRVSDSSDPIPETNRLAVDQIYERAREATKQFTNFARDPRSFSKLEVERWVRVYVEPKPLGAIYLGDTGTETKLVELLASSRQPLPALGFGQESEMRVSAPFTAAHMTGDSILLSQTDDRNAGDKSLSLEIDFSGRARFLIPFDTKPFTFDSLGALTSESAREFLAERLAVLILRRITDLVLIDVGRALWAFAAHFRFYQTLIAPQAPIDAFKYVVEVGEVNRCVPFVDFDGWGAIARQLGLTVLHTSTVRSPTSLDSSWVAENRDGAWIPIAADIAQCFGFPRSFFADILMHASATLAGSSPAPSI